MHRENLLREVNVGCGCGNSVAVVVARVLISFDVGGEKCFLWLTFVHVCSREPDVI